MIEVIEVIQKPKLKSAQHTACRYREERNGYTVLEHF